MATQGATMIPQPTEERTLTLETLTEEQRLAQATLDSLNALITLMAPEDEIDPEGWSRQECEPGLMSAVDRLYELTAWYDEQICERDGAATGRERTG